MGGIFKNLVFFIVIKIINYLSNILHSEKYGNYFAFNHFFEKYNTSLLLCFWYFQGNKATRSEHVIYIQLKDCKIIQHDKGLYRDLKI